MPKILRILNRLNLGGPTYNATYLTKYLEPEFNTKLVVGAIDDSEASSRHIAEALQIEPHYLPEMQRDISPVRDRKAYKKLKQIIKDFKPDIVHTHAAKSGALGRLAASSLKVPVILHTFHGHVFHSYFNPIKTKAFIRMEKHLASKSNKIIAISPIQKKELSEDFKICKPEKIEIVRLGFDLDKFSHNQEAKRKAFRSTYQIADEEIAIGIIGRLVPVKNHGFFLRVVKEILKSTDKKVRFLIVGDGEERANIESFANILNIPFSIEKDTTHNRPLIFTSWIKDVDVVTAGLDIVTLTSLNEGTPVSLIEAQSANRAIVSTRVGGIEDVVSEGQTALLSDKTDEHSFTNHLLTLINDANLRQKMGSQGGVQVRDLYSHTRLVEDMRRLYSQLLSEV